MYALTIWQPWAWAIIHDTKRVEHRTWRPRLRQGQWFAVHAGKHDQNAACLIRAHLKVGVPDKSELPQRAIIGVAEYLGIIDSSTPQEDVPPMDVPWWDGSMAWRIGRVIALPSPIAATGLQGLWIVQDDVEKRVRRALRDMGATASALKEGAA